MKRYKKIIYVILMICILAGSVFAALDFMGVVDLNFRNKKFGEDVSVTENEADSNSNTENETNTNNPEPWHIVFKGYAFSVEPVGLAIIHESGCINIRSCDEYLIQIDVEDGTAEEFWNGRDDCVKNMEDSGYVIELAPEKVELQGREYIRYIISLANERGADVDNTYFYVLVSDAGDDQRFFTVIKFDEINIASLNVKEKGEIYEKSVDEVTSIVAGAVPTDETNDMAGSYWQETQPIENFATDNDNNIGVDNITGADSKVNKNSDDNSSENDILIKDSITNEDTIVSYELPEGYILTDDDLSGKKYYSDNDRVNVTISVVPYTWMTAADMAERERRAGISKVIRSGQYEVSGVTFYYYTYSILYIRGEKRSITYHFNGYADLKNGDIYSVYGFADDNPAAIEPGTYADFMKIHME